MFGWINDCTEKLVLSKFGVEVWHQVKEKAGCVVGDGCFVRHEYYPDESTVALVVAASEVLGITVDQVLEAFGTYFMEFTRAEGYESLLQCQGNTLQSWLSNMNALHDHLESSLPRGMVKPVFWCENDDDNDYAMILHYYSKRGNLLVPLVVGVVKEVARFHFSINIDMIMLRKQAVDGATHTSWSIKAVDPKDNWKVTMNESNLLGQETSVPKPTVLKCPFSGTMLKIPQEEKATASDPNREGIPTASCGAPEHGSISSQQLVPSPKFSKEPNISSRQMKKIFPYHIVVNESFDIIQVGASLAPLMEREESDLAGQQIHDVLCITRPILGTWDWPSLKKLENQTFFVDAVGDKVQHIKFKANIIKISEPDEALQVMFVLSPDVKNVKELRQMNLTMSDLPLHSFQRDAVFLGEHIVAEIQSSHKLDRLSKKLKHEQHLSRVLLYSMLPPHVADDLRAGKTVQPQLHDNVTLFFSDIVGFTTICDEIFPWDCVDLLNRLYCVMDFLAAKFDLYKIETIGDSYLCASGLPKDDPKHATNIANFAIAVLHCCKLVTNPTTGQPIQLRIGMHSGSCMTGVVGMTTPHYCVFGDMVNTASRHESTSLPGKIQCSSITYGLLQHFSEVKEFAFVPRGLIEMKGKGLMATYFLDRATDENSSVNPAALDALYDEVEKILAVRKFSNKRYFKRYGRRASETCFGSATDSVSSDMSSDLGPDDDIPE